MMDTSATFALMLDKAIEAGPGVFVDFDRTKNVQDQLQEMASLYEPMEHEGGKFQRLDSGKMLALLDLDTHAYDETYAYGPLRCFTPRFQSMEQLWLAFCMSEKFNKTRNGEDWE